MVKNSFIVTGVTFGLFFGEALIHYNMGVHKETNGKKEFIFPSGKEMVKLAGVVLVFSVLSGVIVNQISK